MKSLHTLIFSALFAAILFWHAPGVAGDGAAGNPNPLSTSKPDPSVVPSAHTAVSPASGTPGTSKAPPVDFPLFTPVAVLMALLLLIFWQKFGIVPGVVRGEIPSMVLKNLIRDVEESSGYTRNDARAKAKAWLVGNVTSLGENEIFLAKSHFSYLLPSDWGLQQHPGTHRSRS